MASQMEESDSEEESSFTLSDNENLVPPKKKRRGRKAQSATGSVKLVLHFQGPKWAESTANFC